MGPSDYVMHRIAKTFFSLINEEKYLHIAITCRIINEFMLKGSVKVRSYLAGLSRAGVRSNRNH